MAEQYDLVIRGGLVVDGTGAEPRLADVAISGGIIRLVGEVEGSGLEEIDASGLLVTPGFVDLHTHYDGQAIWSKCLNPSSSHGVTTVVMGNCGVGFAPCRPPRPRFPTPAGPPPAMPKSAARLSAKATRSQPGTSRPIATKRFGSVSV